MRPEQLSIEQQYSAYIRRLEKENEELQEKLEIAEAIVKIQKIDIKHLREELNVARGKE